MLDQQSSVAPFPGNGRFDGLVQSIALLVVMTAAGLFAVLVFTRDQPTVAQEPPASSERSDTVTTTTTLTATIPTRLLILVETGDRADTLRLWRHAQPILDAHSFAGVEVAGPIPNAALREALVFANVACVQEGCTPVSVLDLRGANPE